MKGDSNLTVANRRLHMQENVFFLFLTSSTVHKLLQEEQVGRVSTDQTHPPQAESSTLSRALCVLVVVVMVCEL